MTRMPAVLGLRKQMKRSEWHRLIGEHWASCDNLWKFQAQIRRTLRIRGPIRDMMNKEENAAYDSLPDVVTCFRGCAYFDVRGLSWTLDYELAHTFPFLPVYGRHNPIVWTKTVRKTDIAAIQLRRKEAELIILSTSHLGMTEEPASKEIADRVFAARHAEMMAALKQVA